MKIMIKDQQWTIKDVRCLENCIGRVIYQLQEIEIFGGVPKETRKATIIHELTHAVMWVYGFGQFESLNREQICDFIGCYGEEIMALTAKVLKEKL